MDTWYEALAHIVGSSNVYLDEDMSKHTTFRAGGKAKYFVNPGNEKQLEELIRIHKEAKRPYVVLGNGSNLLVRDCGYDGTMIHIGEFMNRIHIDGVNLEAESGALLSVVANLAKKQELTGLEFAAGIPGSLGGAVTMNAGAYGGEMKDIITEVKVMDENGNCKVLSNADMEFGYRSSVVQKEKFIVISVKMKLAKGHVEAIEAKMQELLSARKEKQPLEYPSAGSTFKRPEGYFAGKLIQDAGLRGYCVGGACVSEKHCGFVINKDHATAADIITLMEDVARIVKEKFNVVLEPEVKVI